MLVYLIPGTSPYVRRSDLQIVWHSKPVDGHAAISQLGFRFQFFKCSRAAQQQQQGGGGGGGGGSIRYEQSAMYGGEKGWQIGIVYVYLYSVYVLTYVRMYVLYVLYYCM